MDPKSETWRKAAHDIITELAASNTLIVSDMVVSALETANMGLNNYSALGGVFTRAAKAGLIIKTDETQPGNRKSHSAKTVWRSLIYQQSTPVNAEMEAVLGIMRNALEFNAVTVRYASQVIAAGPGFKPQHLKRIRQEFVDITDKYQAQNIKILDRLGN